LAHEEGVTKVTDALDFAEQLAAEVRLKLCDVRFVCERVVALEPLAKGFPETRFCKGCVLPIVDELANRYLTSRYGASGYDVFESLRCEGYHNLSAYYPTGNGKTGFSSYARGNTYRSDCKQGTGRASRPSPDFCIRLSDPSPFRLVGESKFSLKPISTAKLAADLLHDLRYYLAINSEPNSDWGHDFGIGVGYCAADNGMRDAQIVHDHWDSDHILLVLFGRPPHAIRRGGGGPAITHRILPPRVRC
jgi:hypothetical protein